MNHYFGSPWDAPFIAPARQVPTPVGESCLGCEEPIVEGDRGVLMPLAHVGDDGQPAHRMAAEHRECFLLGVLGHLAGQCYCHDGLGSHRERGRRTAEWLRRNKIAKTN